MELTETGRLLSGRYRLRAVVGQGGMGVVWQARDELLNRDVAVKELGWPPHFTEAEQQTACRRAVREAQMAGLLVHILNRNVLANAQHAYALYGSTPVCPAVISKMADI